MGLARGLRPSQITKQPFEGLREPPRAETAPMGAWRHAARADPHLAHHGLALRRHATLERHIATVDQ